LLELIEDIPAEKQEEILDKVAVRIVNYGMAVPAILFLEVHRPLNVLGSSVMIILQPFVHSILDYQDFGRLAVILEKRENIGKLIDRIEVHANEPKKQEVKTG
jgi:hypothetical protein